MGEVYEAIDAKLAGWLSDQPVFFVGTAPSGADGHVNVSPKGMAGTFAVLGPHQVGYLDYFGSGVETIAHLKQNGRIALMWCAFDGRPRVVRLHGHGRVVLAADPAFAELRPHFSKQRDHGARSVIVVEVDRISNSCGYSVPKMQFVQDREVLDLHQLKRPAEFFDEYAVERNSVSIDGLPGLR